MSIYYKPPFPFDMKISFCYFFHSREMLDDIFQLFENEISIEINFNVLLLLTFFMNVTNDFIISFSSRDL